MKTLFSILGLISAILALILAIFPTEKIALIPAIAAFVFVLIALFISKQDSKKLIKFVFLVTVLALAIIIYKSIFSDSTKVTEDQQFIEQTEETEQNALEELEDMPELDTFEDDSDSIQ